MTLGFIIDREPLPYEEGLLQLRRLHSQRVEGLIPDTVLLTEHQPVITLGRYADTSGVLASSTRLEALGVAVHRIERGGEATVHLPGQLVAYPVISLKAAGFGVRDYINRLEEAMLRVAARFGIEVGRTVGLPGVYAEGCKFGSVGVAVKRGVTLHGLALNVDCDLTYFDLINPCGRSDIRPTSLARLLARAVSMKEARAALRENLSDVLAATP